ncbi:hypothetical protein ACIQYL_20960 [Lysinibacillus xylanilyticus]|uniref:hypothetical protein n=1 Tax=Lysinibacillus xylanilyticus TaxID=582475 RepID=UPI00381D707B
MTLTMNGTHKPNHIFTYTKKKIDFFEDSINFSVKNRLLRETKIMQVKMRRQFAYDYAVKKYKLNTMSMFILHVITSYTDIDMSIQCELEKVREVVNLRRDTFEIAINQLFSKGLLIKGTNNKINVTNKSHVLVSPTHLESNSGLYIAEYDILCDPRRIKGLKQGEHRFLYFIALQCSSSPSNSYTPLVTRLYNNKLGRISSDYTRTHLSSFEELAKVLLKLWKFNSISFSLINESKKIKLVYNNQNTDEKLESVDELYENLLKKLNVETKAIKFNEQFVKHLKVHINCYSLQTQQSFNIASKTELENYLNVYGYNLESMFSDTAEIYNASNNQANLMINYKKELATIVGTKMACQLYSSSLKSFIDENATSLRYFVLHEKAVSQFRDFYLLKRIENEILEQLKIYTILNNSDIKLDYQIIQFNRLQVEITDEQFNNLISYYAENANRNHLIFFIDKLEKIVSKFKSENESDFIAYLDMLTKKFKGLNIIFKTYYEKVRKLYANVVTKNQIELTLEAFCISLPTIQKAVGHTNEEVLRKYINAIAQEARHELQELQVTEIIEHYEQNLLDNVTQLPIELVTLARSKNVHPQFFQESPVIVDKYLESIFTIKTNTDLTKNQLVEHVQKLKDKLRHDMQLLIYKHLNHYESTNKQQITLDENRSKVPFYNWLEVRD